MFKMCAASPQRRVLHYGEATLCSGGLLFAVAGQKFWVESRSGEGLFAAAYSRGGLKFFSPSAVV